MVIPIIELSFIGNEFHDPAAFLAFYLLNSTFKLVHWIPNKQIWWEFLFWIFSNPTYPRGHNHLTFYN